MWTDKDQQQESKELDNLLTYLARSQSETLVYLISHAVISMLQGPWTNFDLTANMGHLENYLSSVCKRLTTNLASEMMAISLVKETPGMISSQIATWKTVWLQKVEQRCSSSLTRIATTSMNALFLLMLTSGLLQNVPGELSIMQREVVTDNMLIRENGIIGSEMLFGESPYSLVLHSVSQMKYITHLQEQRWDSKSKHLVILSVLSIW